ncbi:MAG: hypothetical protein ACPGXX_05615 [Planctomycetaceae bacterium]
MISDQLRDRGRSHGLRLSEAEWLAAAAVFGQGRDVSAAGVTDGFLNEASH